MSEATVQTLFGLTPTEAKIVNALLEPAYLTHRELETAVWGKAVHANLICVHLNNIRTKMAAHDVTIENMRNTGYRISKTHKDTIARLLQREAA